MGPPDNHYPAFLLLDATPCFAISPTMLCLPQRVMPTGAVKCYVVQNYDNRCPLRRVVYAPQVAYLYSAPIDVFSNTHAYCSYLKRAGSGVFSTGWDKDIMGSLTRCREPWLRPSKFDSIL